MPGRGPEYIGAETCHYGEAHRLRRCDCTWLVEGTDMNRRELLRLSKAAAVVAGSRAIRPADAPAAAPDAKGSEADLLARAAAHLADCSGAPDDEWWRDYFTLLRQPMILTEEGWEEPEAAEWYRQDDPDWEPYETLSFDDPAPGR
jgi:hypothetical protein